MNREQKAAAVAEIAANIKESQAVFAVDYRGLSVPQASELRSRLRAADARFAVVKNTLTERAADEAGAEALKELLQGPTALTFVHGDAAAAAKAISDYGRETDLLPFKGGFMDGNALSAEDIGAIAKLPSRDVLYAQLVNIVAYPLSGLARTLNQLIGGLAVALGQIRDLDPPVLAAGDAPAPVAEADAPAAEAESPSQTPDAGDDQDAEPASTPDEPQPDQAEGDDAPAETS
jgi:large subunit ribosomal protein L10